MVIWLYQHVLPSIRYSTSYISNVNLCLMVKASSPTIFVIRRTYSTQPMNACLRLPFNRKTIWMSAIIHETDSEIKYQIHLEIFEENYSVCILFQITISDMSQQNLLI